MGDALGVDLFGVDPGVGGEGGQDADLAAGVDALDVRGRVLLGVAVVLGDLQSFLEGEVLIDHLGEDEVRRAVQDAVDGLDFVAGQAEDEGSDERDAAADTGLEHVVDVVLLRDGEEFGTASGHELLVGGDHVLAGGKALRGEVEGRVDTAHGLRDDLDGVIVQDVVEVLRELPFVRVPGEVPEVQDVFDFEVFLGSALFDVGMLGVDDLYDAGTDGTVTHDSNVHASFPPISVLQFYFNALNRRL